MTKFNIEEEAKRQFSHHVMMEIPAKSFRFRTPVAMKKYVPYKATEGAYFSLSSFYAFSLTWSPGVISVAGDIGELTITHGYDLGKFEDAIRWVANADYDYLMSKSGVQKVYDADATYEDLIADANRPVVECVMGHRDWDVETQKYVYRGGVREDMRRFRKDLAEAKQQFADAHKEWRECNGKDDEEPINFFDYDDRASYDYKITRREPTRRFGMTDLQKRTDAFDIPDCWDFWVRIWDQIGYGEVTEVMKPAARRAMKERLKEICFNQHELLELIRDMDLDDYEASYRFPSNTRWQIAALKFGCQMLIDSGVREAA